MTRLIPALVFLLVVPLRATAQPAQDSWDNLKQLQPVGKSLTRGSVSRPHKETRLRRRRSPLQTSSPSRRPKVKRSERESAGA